jgi:hypothetical protein
MASVGVGAVAVIGVWLQEAGTRLWMVEEEEIQLEPA